MFCRLTTFFIAHKATFLPISRLASLTVVIVIKGVVALIGEERLAGFALGFFECGDGRSKVIDETGKGIGGAVAGIAVCWDVLASINEFVVEKLL